MVRRKTDAEVLGTLYDALQALQRGEMGEATVCLILQNELEPSIMTDDDREWAQLQVEALAKNN